MSECDQAQALSVLGDETSMSKLSDLGDETSMSKLRKGVMIPHCLK